MSRFVAKLSPISPLVSFDVGGSFQSGGINAEDNCNLNLGEGVEYFTERVLFVAGNARRTSALIGNRSRRCSSRTDLVAIPDVGHEMFGEDPADSIAVMRHYLNS